MATPQAETPRAATTQAETAQQASDHIETATDTAAFSDWPEGVHDDMMAHQFNGCVGSLLVSETERVRVWQLQLPPGQRCAFHRHVNPYFWTAHAPGSVRSYFSDGRMTEGSYYKGETAHFHYGPGEYMLHCIENTGDSDLLFTTVEFLDNDPLPVPDSVRLTPPARSDRKAGGHSGQ